MGSCARTEPSGPSARQALAAGPWHHLCASVYWHFDLHSSTGAFPGGARVWRKRGMTGWQLMGPAYFLPGLAVRGLSRAGHGQGGVRCSQGAASCWGGATGLHPSPLGMRNAEFGPVPTPWLWESDRPPWAPSREGAARALWGGGGYRAAFLCSTLETQGLGARPDDRSCGAFLHSLAALCSPSLRPHTFSLKQVELAPNPN